ncbi:hypothetical protein ADL05_09095 [Nocardiopsis sp. NRRL B-16309]|nr:hypothetical protein ADL05_09095 [Nocardiopsis sp. NRRL B-16309]
MLGVGGAGHDSHHLIRGDQAVIVEQRLQLAQQETVAFEGRQEGVIHHGCDGVVQGGEAEPHHTPVLHNIHSSGPNGVGGEHEQVPARPSSQVRQVTTKLLRIDRAAGVLTSNR